MQSAGSRWQPAGTGGLPTVEAWLARRSEVRAHAESPDRQREPAPLNADRRAFLQLGALVAASVGLATLARGFVRPLAATATTGSDVRAAPGGTSAAPSPTPGPGEGASPGASPNPAATDANGGGTLLGNIDQLPVGRAGRFRVATTGDPAVIVHLQDGSVVAYDAVCTHQGCTVGYDSGSGLLLCPCHGAAFDPTHHAEVVGGPTNTPLTELPIKVDPTTGSIYLLA